MGESEFRISERYSPLPNQMVFHESSARFRAYVGGFGSGKTLAGCWEALMLCIRNPGIEGVIARVTMPALRDTTMKTFFDICPYSLIESYRKQENILTLRTAGKKKSTILFRAVGENIGQTKTRFASLSPAFIFVDEATDISESQFHYMSGRIRQKNMPHYMFFTTNPCGKRHWLYTYFSPETCPDPDTYAYIKAPSTENPHLPEDYIPNLLSMYSPDMVSRYVEGNFGVVMDGKRVYPEFEKNIHVRNIEYDALLPIHRSWDFGMHTPAVIYAQIDGRRLKILGEKIGRDVLLKNFAEDVKKHCNDTYGSTAKYVDCCDPAGNQVNDKSPQTSVQILRETIGNAVTSRPHRILEGVMAVRTALNMKDGIKPFIEVDPSCTNLIEGFSGGYHYPKKYEGSGDDPLPEKDGEYDHLQDCLRYLFRNSALWAWFSPKEVKKISQNTFVSIRRRAISKR